jgi:hypothetical protein
MIGAADRQRISHVVWVSGAVGLLAASALMTLPGLAAPPPAPSVAQVLAVCARAESNGGRGVDAAMCEWYANPCGCKPETGNEPRPRWCIPSDEPAAVTVRRVVAALRRYSDRAASVDRVVPEILARTYPCAADAVH